MDSNAFLWVPTEHYGYTHCVPHAPHNTPRTRTHHTTHAPYAPHNTHHAHEARHAYTPHITHTHARTHHTSHAPCAPQHTPRTRRTSGMHTTHHHTCNNTKRGNTPHHTHYIQHHANTMFPVNVSKWKLTGANGKRVGSKGTQCFRIISKCFQMASAR